MQKTRMLAALLVLAALLSLAACGKAETDDATPEELTESWVAQCIPAPEDAGWAGADATLYEGVLYFSLRADHAPAILCYDTRSESWDRLTLDLTGLVEPDLRSISAADGVLWGLLRDWPDGGDPSFYLLRIDLSSPAPAAPIPVSMTAEPDPEGGVRLFYDLIALDRDRALLSDSAGTYCVGSRGERLAMIDSEDAWLAGVRVERVDGELYFPAEGGKTRRLDRESLRMAETLDWDCSMYSESENGHLFALSPDREVSAFEPEAGEESLWFGWMDVAVDGQSLGAHQLFETDTGDCYYLARQGLVRLSRVMAPPKTELELLCLVEETELVPDDMQGAGQYMDAIFAFNSANPAYKIRVTTVRGSREDLTQSLIDLVAGADYDLIDTGFLPEGALDSGLLTDLLPYLDADTEIGREDFIPAALAGMLRGGRLYAVTPYVQIMTWAMRADQYPGKESWTPEYVKQLIASCGEAQVFFWTRDQQLLMRILAKMATAEFIDYDSASCRFDDGRFAAWLELLRDIPYSTEYSEARNLFEPLFEWQAGTPWFIKKALQSEDYVYCGFPGASGSGHYFARVGQNLGAWISDPAANVSMGILETSRHKDAAWVFLRVLLQQNDGSGIPVLAARFEQQIAGLAVDEELRGYQCFTAADVEKLRALVYAADKTVREDAQLLELISGVAEDYLAGRYTGADEAAQQLQSRASVYVAEQYG